MMAAVSTIAVNGQCQLHSFYRNKSADSSTNISKVETERIMIMVKQGNNPGSLRNKNQ